MRVPERENSENLKAERRGLKTTLGSLRRTERSGGRRRRTLSGRPRGWGQRAGPGSSLLRAETRSRSGAETPILGPEQTVHLTCWKEDVFRRSRPQRISCLHTPFKKPPHYLCQSKGVTDEEKDTGWISRKSPEGKGPWGGVSTGPMSTGKAPGSAGLHWCCRHFFNEGQVHRKPRKIISRTKMKSTKTYNFFKKRAWGFRL